MGKCLNVAVMDQLTYTALEFVLYTTRACKVIARTKNRACELSQKFALPYTHIICMINVCALQHEKN